MNSFRRGEGAVGQVLGPLGGLSLHLGEWLLFIFGFMYHLPEINSLQGLKGTRNALLFCLQCSTLLPWFLDDCSRTLALSSMPSTFDPMPLHLMPSVGLSWLWLGAPFHLLCWSSCRWTELCWQVIPHSWPLFGNGLVPLLW